jgi:hypothetical protein
VLDAVLREVVADPESAYRPVAVLYQDFLVRCRSRNLNGRMLDLPAFRRRLATARAGVTAAVVDGPEWESAVAAAADLPEDIQAVFLLLARAALEGDPCPSDAEVARACGSRSSGRARRLLSFMEQRGYVVCHDAAGGGRVIELPGLGWRTLPGAPDAPEDGWSDVA